MSAGPCAHKRRWDDADLMLCSYYKDYYDDDDCDDCDDCDDRDCNNPSTSAPPPNLLRWRDRDAVVASGIGLHAQMERDLAQEAAARPQSGLVNRKTFVDAWTFESERYAYWTRVRGCVERLDSIGPQVNELADVYRQEVERIRRNLVPGKPRANDGRVATERSRSICLNALRKRCDSAVYPLYPEPMRAVDWRALRFYPQSVRSVAEAVAFVDPQATPEELRFAVVRGGLDALCARCPEVLAKHPALATAYVAHLAADPTAPRPSPWRMPPPRMHFEQPIDPTVERDVREPTKAVRAEAFLKHLRTLRAPAAVASLVPPDAVAHLANGTLRTPTPKHVLFAARVLGLLPVASLAPHADALAEAVGVHGARVRAGAGAHVHTALGLLEKLTAKLHHPANVDMAAAHASAMAQEGEDAVAAE